MLVFGDPQFSENCSESVSRFRAQIASTNPNSLDELRALFIEAGQIEQGVSDAFGSSDCNLEKQFQHVTDLAASAFYAALSAECPDLPPPRFDVRSAMEFLTEAVDCCEIPKTQLTLKTPEGYQFYSLYPEQFCFAAANWARENRSTEPVLVAGIRSIGTGLSALVTEVQRCEGKDATRITARPTGYPFERTAIIDPPRRSKIRDAIVVDEGPGISGSSMVAVADALVRIGLRRISFFPGHSNPPGDEATDHIRNWWNSAPLYFTPLQEVRWKGWSLREKLLRKTNELGCETEEFVSVEDLSNGLWRARAYAQEDDWPAAAIPFERTKFLCQTRGGKAVLWKFVGLMRRSSHPISPGNSTVQTLSQLGEFRGFVATPWIEGARLVRGDADAAFLSSVGTYIKQVAGRSLSRDEISSGLERLSLVTETNLTETGGSFETDKIHCLLNSAKIYFAENPNPLLNRSYGDGRMAPHEWIRTHNGTIFKTDSDGHDSDHTIVGAQSLLWDFAGAMVEWSLDINRAKPLLNPLRSETNLNHDLLNFFRLAYAAFRMGKSSLCAHILAHNPPEQRRSLRDFGFYRNAANQIIVQSR